MPVANFAAILNHSVRVLRRVEGSIDDFGHPAITETVISGDGLSCYFWAKAGAKPRKFYGEEVLTDHRMMTGITAIMQAGDIIEPLIGIDGLTRGQIVFVKGIMNLTGGTHHLEAEVKSL